MDKTQYIKRIVWAKNMVWPLIIFSFVVVFIYALQMWFGIDNLSVMMRAMTFVVELVATIIGIIYMMGFWAMGKRFDQKKIRVGAGMLVGTLIFSFIADSVYSFLLGSDVARASSGITLLFSFAYLFIVFVVMGIGYIFLGKGLGKLESDLGTRSRTIGNLFLASGICTLTFIGVIGALVLWIIAYIMSYKLFVEEIKKN